MVFERRIQSLIHDDLLPMRSKLYKRYYENPDKLVADSMLAHAIHFAVGEKLWKIRRDETTSSKAEDLADKMALLTDSQFLDFLLRVSIGDSRTPLLLMRIMGNNCYWKAGTIGLPDHELDEVDQIANWFENKTDATLNPDLLKKAAAGGWMTSKKAVEEAERTKRKQQNTEDATLTTDERMAAERQAIKRLPKHCIWTLFLRTAETFENQYEIEKLIWSELLDVPDFKDAWRKYRAAEYGVAEAANSSNNQVEHKFAVHLDDTPHVFLYVPPHRKMAAASSRGGSREPSLGNWLGFAETDGGTLFEPVEIPMRKSTSALEGYLFGPQELVKEYGGTINAVATNFIFEKLDWVGREPAVASLTNSRYR